MNKTLQEFNADEVGNLIHYCGKVGEWEDCDKHPDLECYALACGKCGVWLRDCEGK